MFLKIFSPPWRKRQTAAVNMPAISHILIVISIETVLVACSSSNAIKIKCTNIDEFHYATPESHCSAYYRCTSRGQRDVEECSPGAMFDFYMQTCTRSAGVCYEPICTGRTNGIYQDTTHACRRSYTCFAGQVTSIDNCPPKHLHNGHKCVQQDLVTCDLPETTAIGYPFSGDQRCKEKPDGQYAVNGNCLEYIVCAAGQVSDVKNCPNEYRFERVKQECLPKHLVGAHCSDSGGSSATSLVIDDFVCQHKRDGANVDPSSSDCNTYVMCRDGKLEAQKRCSNQAVFNGESCVPSPLYQCPSHIRRSSQLIDHCHRRANGFYASPQHGCSSYVRCMAEKAVEVNACPKEQYFDPESRNCIYERFRERRRCHDRGISLDCDGKADSYYKESNCDSYYYCHGGYKTEYKCSSGKVFNGATCVPKSQYKCSRTEGDDSFCLSRPDGYYKDPNDGCRTYQYCSSGHKITYLCEHLHFFDGKAKKCTRQEIGGGQAQCRADYLCYGKSDGYHADLRSNCRNYVYCKNDEKITQLTCRDSNVFNGQKCVPPRDYACPSLYNHRQQNCMPKSCARSCEMDGFYPDLNSDCRDYFFCIGGKASKLSCPSGRRFNGEICVAEDKFSCPVFCEKKNESYDNCPLGGYVV